MQEVQINKEVLDKADETVKEALEKLKEMASPGWSITSAMSNLSHATLKDISDTVHQGGTTEGNITTLTAPMIIPTLQKLKERIKQLGITKILMEQLFLAHYADKYFENGAFNNGNFRTAASTIFESRQAVKQHKQHQRQQRRGRRRQSRRRRWQHQSEQH